MRGLFRGNLATVVKVFPASAIQFSTYDSVKDVMLLSQSQRGGGMGGSTVAAGPAGGRGVLE